MATVIVVDYNPSWPTTFQQLHAHIWPAVQDIALTIEHVGSTSVPGLAAKPIIDMSIIVPSEREIVPAIERLATLGYEHLGNLGVEGREAFKRPEGTIAHNLYLCPQGSLGIRNHLAVRDYLRAHPETASAYGERKKRLADEFPDDIDRYVDGKTDTILRILREQGLSDEDLSSVESANIFPAIPPAAVSQNPDAAAPKANRER